MSLSNAEKKVCPKCKQTLPSDSEFCQFCGANIENSPFAIVKNAPKETIVEPSSAFQIDTVKKSQNLPVIISILSTVIVALIAVLIILLVGNNKKDTEIYNVGIRTVSFDDRSKAEYIFNSWEATKNENTIINLMDRYGAEQGGGKLYIISSGEFVKEIEEWCFSSERKPGDCEIIKTAYGYSLCYYSGCNLEKGTSSTNNETIPNTETNINSSPSSQGNVSVNSTNNNKIDYTYKEPSSEKYTCLNAYCNNKVLKIGSYCAEHKCQNGDCEYEKEPNLKYCSICLCGTSGCSNAKIANGSYCSKHKCENGDCGSEKEPNAKYCSICICGAPGCSNVQIRNAYYCNDHMCSEKNCQFQKAKDEKYCSYHACDICGELRTSGSLYCSEHD